MQFVEGVLDELGALFGWVELLTALLKSGKNLFRDQLLVIVNHQKLLPNVLVLVLGLLRHVVQHELSMQDAFLLCGDS